MGGGVWARIAAGCRRPLTWAWLAVIALAVPQGWHQLHVAIDPVIDLHVYRDAGVSLLHGDPVYSHYVITKFSVLPFTYPPIAALLAVPLALLPLLVVGAVWDLAIYAALAWVLRLFLVPVRAALRSRHPAWEPYLLPVAWLAGVYSILGQQQVHFGQVGVFLLLLICLDLLTPHTGRFRGVLVGLATAVKLTPGIFIVALWLAGRRRAAGMAAATVGLLTGLAALIAPGASRTYWTSALFDSDRLGNNADVANQSLRGLLLRTPLQHGAATGAFLLVALVVGAVGLRKATRAWAAGDELMAVTLTGLLMALLSPVAWVHHFVFVWPLAVIFLRDRRWRSLAAMALLWGNNWAVMGAHHLAKGQLPALNPLWYALQASLGLSVVWAVLWLPPRRSHREFVDSARAPQPADHLLARAGWGGAGRPGPDGGGAGQRPVAPVAADVLGGGGGGSLR